jgi:hypothetical protein
VTTSLLALVDESTPHRPGGVQLVLSAFVLLEDDRIEIRRRVEQITAGRRRPFRWRLEGPRARDAMVSLMNELPAIGISRVRYPVAPRQLERSRSSLFGMLTTDLVAEGVDEVLFESRSWADHFDRATLANLKADGLVPEDLQVSWPDKREPLLWIADALAGIVVEHLRGDPSPFAANADVGLLDIRWG